MLRRALSLVQGREERQGADAETGDEATGDLLTPLVHARGLDGDADHVDEEREEERLLDAGAAGDGANDQCAKESSKAHEGRDERLAGRGDRVARRRRGVGLAEAALVDIVLDEARDDTLLPTARFNAQARSATVPNIYTPKAQQGREGVAHPKRRPASDWKRQRATTKTGARSLVTTSSTSSCGWNVDGARDVGAEPGPVFLSEAAREGAAEPASVWPWKRARWVLGGRLHGRAAAGRRMEKEGERGFRSAGPERKAGLMVGRWCRTLLSPRGGAPPAETLGRPAFQGLVAASSSRSGLLSPRSGLCTTFGAAGEHVTSSPEAENGRKACRSELRRSKLDAGERRSRRSPSRYERRDFARCEAQRGPISGPFCNLVTAR